MKKISKLNKLKQEVKYFKDTAEAMERDRNEYRDILNQIRQTLRENSGLMGNDLMFRDMPKRIIELQCFRKMNEGAYHPLRDVIENQREIIRWLIKPSTAERPTQEIIDEWKRKGMWK